MAEISKHPKDAELKAPLSPGLRWGALHVVQKSDNPMAKIGLALGICWLGAGRPRTKLDPIGLGAYGLKVYDELLARDGVTMRDLDTAGARALTVLNDSIENDPTGYDIEAARGNSEARADG